MATKKTSKKTDKSPKSAKSEPSTIEHQAGDRYAELPLAEVKADFGWNARQGDWINATVDSDKGDHGFKDLVASIQSQGQDDPVLVRPRKSGRGYDLVAGFRRYAALQLIQKESGKNVTIKCVIRELTDLQARSANIRENTARDDLRGPDLAFSIADYCREYEKVTKQEPTSGHVASEIGKNQSYCNRLMTITKKVNGELLQRWRDNPMAISVMAMHDIAGLDTPEKQTEKFESLVGGKKGGARGPGAWVETAKSKMARIGALFGKLERAGLIMCDDLQWSEHLDYFDVLKKADKEGKGGATAAQRKAIAKSARDAYRKAYDGGDDSAEADGEE